MTTWRARRCGRAGLRVLAALAVLPVMLGAQAIAPPRAPAAAPAATGRVRGVVVDAETGRPVPFATIHLVTAAGAPRGIRRNVVTADDGTFEIRDVDAGTYALAAAKPAYATVFYRRSGGGSTDAGDPLLVAAGEQIDGLRLRLVRGGVIAGRVLDPDGEPVIGASLTVDRMDAPARGLSIFIPTSLDMLRTNARGEYRVWGLVPGDYRIAAIPYGDVGGVPLAPMWFPGATDVAAAQRITLSSGQVRDGIDFPTVPIKRVALSGVVSGAERLTPSTVRVRVRAQDLTAPSLVQAGGSLGAAGRFTVPGVLPGEYWLTASRSPSPGTADPDEPGWAVVPVSVANTDVKDLVLALQPWLTMSGTVRVESSIRGMDPSQLQLTLFAPAESLFGASLTNVVVGPSGTFTAGRLMPGLHQVRLAARAPGAVVTVKAVEVAGRSEATDSIMLAPGESLSGVVIVAEVRAFVP